jgi:Family of unknown function (DUF6011)
MNASDKQADFLKRLATERVTVPGLSAEETVARVDALIASRALTKQRASAMIDAAMQSPKRQAQTDVLASARPGYYVTSEGDFVVVIENKARTRTYAKALVIETTADGKKRGHWEYVAGLGARVAAMEPMTAKQAAAFGHLHGFCVKCCRPLTDPKSVQAGVGPVCAKAFAA